MKCSVHILRLKAIEIDSDPQLCPIQFVLMYLYQAILAIEYNQKMPELHVLGNLFFDKNNEAAKGIRNTSFDIYWKFNRALKDNPTRYRKFKPVIDMFMKIYIGNINK